METMTDYVVIKKQSSNIQPIEEIEPKNDKVAIFGTSKQFLERMHYRNNTKCVLAPEKAIMSEKSPTLFWASKGYSQTIVVQLIMTNLAALSEYSGVRNKITNFQLVELAEAIYERFLNYKVSELMLFFGMVRNGHFGDVGFTSFQPIRILEKIPAFFAYRNRILEREESRMSQAELERASLIASERKKKLEEKLNKLADGLRT